MLLLNQSMTLLSRRSAISFRREWATICRRLCADLVSAILLSLMVVQASAGVSAWAAQSKCVPERFSEARATYSITHLPEFVEKAKELGSPQSLVVGVGSMATARFLDSCCYYEVAIYVNVEDHLELWNVFLIDTNDQVRKVLNSEGDYISLQEWRVPVQAK